MEYDSSIVEQIIFLFNLNVIATETGKKELIKLIF